MSDQDRQRRSLNDNSRRLVYEDGTRLRGYQLSFLTTGGMSTIYKAEKDGASYILKEVEGSNTTEVPSLVSEKTLLERLNHPGIPKVHDFFTEDNHYFLLLEYVPGRPLAHFLEAERRPKVETVVEWAVQLCEIFSYLHAQIPPVIYRDLKSENAILTPEGQVKLIDFGIARVHKGDRAKDTSLMGSPATASPEHYGGAETDARSDIYTLGATIYELLTGGRRKNVGAFRFAPIRELAPEVPPLLEEVLMRCLEFNPQERYQTANELRQALLHASGRPIEALIQGAGAMPAEPPASEVSKESSTATEGDSVEGSAKEQLNRAKKGRNGVLALLAVLAVVVVAFFSSTGLGTQKNSNLEASLQGDLFRVGSQDDRTVVFMGEDVGLFEVTGWKMQTAQERAQTLVDRLNRFYRSECAACGKTKLEPEDIKIARHSESGDTVVFYAHVHPPDLVLGGPELLATVDQAQAERLHSTPRFVASYWRDLIRDTVLLSRGLPVENSAIGEDLSEAMLSARKSLSRDEQTVENLRRILEELTSGQAVRMREAFLKVPEDRKAQADIFQGVRGYEPLTY